MLAHAFLVVAALTSNTCHPPSPELIGLTCNETSTCSPRCWPNRPLISPTGCAGRGGDAGTKPAPGPATTAGRPTDREGNDPRLEY
jgi:hypothetical protein